MGARPTSWPQPMESPWTKKTHGFLMWRSKNSANWVTPKKYLWGFGAAYLVREADREKIHSRALHYFAFSTDYRPPWSDVAYQNSDADWVKIQEAIKYARQMGLISYDQIVDARSPESIHNHIRHYAPETDQSEVLRVLAFDIKWRFRNTFDDKKRDYLVLWCEKTTMNYILNPICISLGMDYYPGQGQVTSTRVSEMVERAKYLKKPLRVFMISDYDFEGQAMVTALIGKLQYHYSFDEEFRALGCSVVHLGLTKEQCVEFDLPEAPVQGKKNEARFREYHGRGYTELDALETYHPGSLETLIRSRVNDFVNFDVVERVSAAHEQIEEAVEGAVDDVIDRIGELLTSVVDAYTTAVESTGITSEDLVHDVDGKRPGDAYDSERPYLDNLLNVKKILGKMTDKLIALDRGNE